jgi:hypothetical protein
MALDATRRLADDRHGLATLGAVVVARSGAEDVLLSSLAGMSAVILFSDHGSSCHHTPAANTGQACRRCSSSPQCSWVDPGRRCPGAGTTSAPPIDVRLYAHGVTSLVPVIAALAGVIAGAVLKHYFDMRAGKRAKLLDEKLKYAVAFLSAADWTGRAFEATSTASYAAQQARTKGLAGLVATAEEQQRLRGEEAYASLKDAHAAASALRLLMPDLSDLASEYIAVAIDAGHDEGVVIGARERARSALETALIKEFGAEPRWWRRSLGR